MDLARKIGIAIVMLVPTFVGSGALWAMFHSFIPVIVWVVLMALVARKIIIGKLRPEFKAQGFELG
ncbi:MAG: hypothetical protein JW836_06485 [Deltaproteobacteria bacterium]|nr:hypothetical protein [Deltaproteobacteria bacterium]